MNGFHIYTYVCMYACVRQLIHARVCHIRYISAYECVYVRTYVCRGIMMYVCMYFIYHDSCMLSMFASGMYALYYCDVCMSRDMSARKHIISSMYVCIYVSVCVVCITQCKFEGIYVWMYVDMFVCIMMCQHVYVCIFIRCTSECLCDVCMKASVYVMSVYVCMSRYAGL